MEQQSVYKKQEKMTFLALLMELPNLAAVTVSAILSQSLLVWLDFVDSLGNVLECSLVAILSHRMTKDLRYTYNYGIGKVEAMTALFSEGMEMCGLLIVGGCIRLPIGGAPKAKRFFDLGSGTESHQCIGRCCTF